MNEFRGQIKDSFLLSDMTMSAVGTVFSLDGNMLRKSLADEC